MADGEALLVGLFYNMVCMLAALVVKGAIGGGCFG